MKQASKLLRLCVCVCVTVTAEAGGTVMVTVVVVVWFGGVDGVVVVVAVLSAVNSG